MVEGSANESGIGRPQVWEGRTGRAVAAWAGYPSGTVRVWETATGRLVSEWAGHSAVVRCVAFAPDGRWVVSGGDDGIVKVWEVATGRPVANCVGHRDRVTCVIVAPDGQWVASGSDDGTVKVWDMAAGRLLADLEGHTSEVTSLACARDGRRLASGSVDGTVKIWEPTGRLVAECLGHSDAVTSVVVEPDGRWVASGGCDGTVKIWDVETGRLVADCLGHDDQITSVAVAPDGSHLVSGSADRTVKLWDMRTAAAVRTLTGHAGVVAAVAFSPDGAQVASGSVDGTVKLWDVPTGTAVRTLAAHTHRVTSVAFAPDGRWLVSGAGDERTRQSTPAADAHELRAQLEGLRNALRGLRIEEVEPVSSGNERISVFANVTRCSGSGPGSASREGDSFDVRLTIFPVVGQWSAVQNLAIVLVGRSVRGEPGQWLGSTGLDGGITFQGVPRGSYRVLLAGDVADATIERVRELLRRTRQPRLGAEVEESDPLATVRARATEQSGQRGFEVAIHPRSPYVNVEGLNVALVGRTVLGEPVFRSARIRIEGGVTFDDLAPGEYQVLATDDLQAATRRAVSELLAGVRLGTLGMMEVSNALASVHVMQAAEETGRMGEVELTVRPHCPLVDAGESLLFLEATEGGTDFLGVISRYGRVKFPRMPLPLAQYRLEEIGAWIRTGTVQLFGGGPWTRTYPIETADLVATVARTSAGRLVVGVEGRALAGATAQYALASEPGIGAPMTATFPLQPEPKNRCAGIHESQMRLAGAPELEVIVCVRGAGKRQQRSKS